MITTLMTALLFTALTPAASPAPREGVGGQRLVGVLTEQFDRECLPGGKERWVNPRFEVGFVPLDPGAVKIPRSLIGKPVVVSGMLRTRRAPPPRPRDPNCPILQMRSDWVEARGGIRVRRTHLAKPGQDFVVTAIKPLADLSVKRVGDKLKVRVRIPADVGLGIPRLEMSYEGCFGKPGTVGKGETSSSWKAGEWMEAEFPVFETEASTGNRKGAPAGTLRYVAHSLAIRAGAPGNAIVDFDYELVRHGGLKLECRR